MPDRRGFFKELLREAAGVAHELSSAMQEATEPEPWRPPPPVPARAASARVDDAGLLALCRETGLEQRAADVRRMVQISLRLTLGGQGRSRLGGSPDLPPGMSWPSWQGRELGFLGQVDLADVAAIDDRTPLPDDGLLLFFYDVKRRPDGLGPSHRGSCCVVLAAGELETDERRVPALRASPIEISRELMLPAAWSFPAELLELSADEMEAWDELRERLARAQGVELEETSPHRLALHRLLGYQDEVGREIEVDCQLASSGLAAEDVAVYYESRADHENEARAWRLLLQLSADELLGTPTDGSFERLYVCARERDLRAARFDEAWAICR